MACLRIWRRWIRQVVMLLYSFILICVLVLIGIELDKHKADTHVWGWFVGGFFVIFTLPISLWGILQHIIYYSKPILQRREIRIMWMVPIYAADAWLALRFPSAAIYLDTLREVYEAYVIYNFMAYLMAYLYESYPFLERDITKRPDYKPIFPLCLFKPWTGKQLLNRCKHGVLQYAVVRPITTAVAFICELCGAYHEGEFKANGSWVYLTVINSISQAWALYCLVLFYKAMKEELAPFKPFRKFLCIKFVIFLSFWQQILVAILVAAKVIKQQADWVLYDTKKAATGIQDFAICIEMFFAAIAHYFAFPHQPYVVPSQVTNIGSFFQSLKDMFHVDDVTEDVREHVKVIGKVASRTFKPGTVSYGSSSERAPLISYQSDAETATIVHEPNTNELANAAFKT